METIGDTRANEAIIEYIWEEDEAVDECILSKLVLILNEEYSGNSDK